MKINSTLPHWLAFFLLLILLFGTNSLKAQAPEKSNIFYSINYRQGINKPERDFLKALTSNYQGVDFKLGWQTQGNRNWQVAYRYPSLGVGASYSQFSNPIIGDPYSVYFFTNFPQLSTKYLQIDFEVNLGACWGMNPYHPVSNPENIAISSSVNFQSAFYLEEAFHLSRQFDLFFGQGLTHISNSSLGYPNMGLNIRTLKAGLRYKPHETNYLNKGKKLEFERKWQINTYLATGIKTFDNPTPLYQQWLISPSVFYRTGFKRRLGIGVELAYNEAIKAYHPKIGIWQTHELMTLATTISHEFLIDRFTVLTQMGFYLKNQPFRWVFYERVGLGYYLTDNIRWVVNLKAHFYIAEYLETGLVFDIDLN